MRKLIKPLLVLLVFAGIILSCDNRENSEHQAIRNKIRVGNKFNYQQIYDKYDKEGCISIDYLYINSEYTEYSVQTNCSDYYAVRMNNKDSIIFNVYKYK